MYMNCNECINEMYQLEDDCIDQHLKADLLNHIAECSDCSKAFDEQQAVLNTLKPRIEIKAPAMLKQNIINEINKNNKTMIAGKMVSLSPVIKRLLSVAAIVAVVLLIIPFVSKNKTSGSTAQAASAIFETSINASEFIKNMTIRCSIRTDASDNFALIGKNYNPVEHTIIKSFESPERWMVEKQGRKAFFDGNNQYLWIPAFKQAIKGSKDANFIEWLKILLEPSSILWKEKEDALTNGSHITTGEANGMLYVAVTSKAQGNFINDYLKNKSVLESDNRREYLFDNKTKLLKGLKVYLLDNKKEVLILNIESIEYDTVIDTNALTVKLPEGVEWQELNRPLFNENFSNINSKKAAELIFESLSKKDFETNKEVWSQFNLITKKILASTYEGCQVIKISEPFKSGVYPGEFVPYEIKLKNGTVKHWKMALRNDNPNKVWIVDGGL